MSISRRAALMRMTFPLAAIGLSKRAGAEAGSDAPAEALSPQELTRKLSVLSGLSLRQLRSLYQQSLAGDGVQSGGAQPSPILVVLERDPHKQMIRSHRGNGEFVDELITGR